MSSDDKAAVADTLRAMYAAVSVMDRARLETEIFAPGFYAYDLGKRFDGMDLVDLIEGAMAAGRRFVWTINEPDVRIVGDRAWIAYVNRGSVGDAETTTPVSWLESAMLARIDGRWRIEFFHSTRAP
jgi:Domain of unknown function (DUF4440)